MKHFNLSAVILLLATTFTYAQNVGINSSGVQPHSSAMLDVSSTTKGMLIPRMTTAQRQAIPNPATGLQVYQTDAPSGFFYYDGTAWQQIGSGSNYAAGNGIGIANNTISALSSNALWNANQLQGFTISGASPQNGQVLQYNSLLKFWVPVTLPAATPSWAITGNTGTDTASNFLGTPDANDLKIVTNGQRQMTITKNGNISVGWPVPNGKMYILNKSTDNQFALNVEDNNSSNPFATVGIYNSNNSPLLYGSKLTDGNLLFLTRSNSTATKDGIVVSTDGVGSSIYAENTSSSFSRAAITGVANGNGYAAGFTSNNSTALFLKGKGGINLNLIPSADDAIDISMPAANNDGSFPINGIYLDMHATGSAPVIGMYSDVYSTTNNTAVYGYYSRPHGTPNPGAYITCFYGEGNINITGSFYSSSDKKLKKNISRLPTGMMSKLMQLSPSNYEYKTSEYDLNLPKGHQFGLVAQDVQEVFPELVQEQIRPATFDKKSNKQITTELKYLGVNYQGLIPVIIAGVQEQQQQLQALQEANNDLKNENTALKKDIAAIKAKLGIQ